MTNTKEILLNRFTKLKRHLSALSDYFFRIKEYLKDKDLFETTVFENLEIEEKAVLDAYLKRFSSVQDYLGARIFPILSELSGINTSKMSEIILQMEKEEIIDSFESWVELRETRNALEHEYPDELEESLNDLKKCLEFYSVLETCYNNSVDFVKKFYPDFNL